MVKCCRAREWKDFVDVTVRRLENDEPVASVLVANKLDLDEGESERETALANLADWIEKRRKNSHVFDKDIMRAERKDIDKPVCAANFPVISGS